MFIRLIGSAFAVLSLLTVACSQEAAQQATQAPSEAAVTAPSPDDNRALEMTPQEQEDTRVLINKIKSLPADTPSRYIVELPVAKTADEQKRLERDFRKALGEDAKYDLMSLDGKSIYLATSDKEGLERAAKAGVLKSVQEDKMAAPQR